MHKRAAYHHSIHSTRLRVVYVNGTMRYRNCIIMHNGVLFFPPAGLQDLIFICIFAAWKSIFSICFLQVERYLTMKITQTA